MLDFNKMTEVTKQGNGSILSDLLRLTTSMVFFFADSYVMKF